MIITSYWAIVLINDWQFDWQKILVSVVQDSIKAINPYKQKYTYDKIS